MVYMHLLNEWKATTLHPVRLEGTYYSYHYNRLRLTRSFLKRKSIMKIFWAHPTLTHSDVLTCLKNGTSCTNIQYCCLLSLQIVCLVLHFLFQLSCIIFLLFEFYQFFSLVFPIFLNFLQSSLKRVFLNDLKQKREYSFSCSLKEYIWSAWLQSFYLDQLVTFFWRME